MTRDERHLEAMDEEQAIAYIKAGKASTPAEQFEAEIADIERQNRELALVEKDARQTAFEQAVSAAGKVLEAELAAAGTDKAARRAAWARYGDAQDAAGAAYRAAQAAERAERARVLRMETGLPDCAPFPGEWSAQ